MSELIQKNDDRATIRWKLLTGASALALTAYVSSAAIANAEDASQPQIWIELGGQLERMDAREEAYAPPFLYPLPDFVSLSPSGIQRPPLYGFAEEGKISFSPEGSDWILSAAIRFGRSNSNNDAHQSTPVRFLVGTVVHTAAVFKDFIDVKSHHDENHKILDFLVGKDVGFGMFGHKGSSVVNAGIRFAQFHASSTTNLNEIPDYYHQHQFPIKYPIHHHSYFATLDTARSFHGIGPTLAWNGSVPFAGDAESMQLAVDWGLNAAVLFGRQKTAAHHQTAEYYHYTKFLHYPPISVTHAGTSSNPHRSQSIVVPNIGGSAGTHPLFATIFSNRNSTTFRKSKCCAARKVRFMAATRPPA